MNAFTQDVNGDWVAAEPIPWLEEHNLLARLIFWIRGIEHCNSKEGQRRRRWWRR